MPSYLVTVKNPVDGTQRHAIVERGTATAQEVAAMLDRLRADYPNYVVTGRDLGVTQHYSVGEVLRSSPIFGRLPKVEG